MDIIGVSVVKNEADIIEAMARHNIEFLDRLMIVNNGSGDRSVEIINALIAEGLPITLMHNFQLGHKQTHIVEEVVNGEHQNNHFIILDADEFLIADSKADVEALFLNQDRVALLPWVTYVTHPNDPLHEKNPILRIGHRKNREFPQYFKTVVPQNIPRPVIFAAGCHGIVGTKRGISEKVKIAHFPVRSPSQIFSKTMIGSWNMRLRKIEHKEGEQWHGLAKEFMQKGMPSYTELCEISNDYAAEGRASLVFDPIKTQATSLKYTNEQDSNILTMISNFTEELVRAHNLQK